MALLFCDGFEDGTTPWTLGGTIAMAVGTGRNGSGLVAAHVTSVATMGFVSTAGPIIAGCAIKPTSAASGIMGFSEPTGPCQHVGIGRGAAGEIIVSRSSAGTMIGSSAAGVVPASAWSYVEAKVVIHDTTGSVVVRVNGVQVLNLTNVDTKDSVVATASRVTLGSSTGQVTVVGNTWDDVYIADTTGSYNNDFIGDVVVEHLRPAADDTAQWVGSDGNSTNNYQLVDEAGIYDGADYVGSATVGQRDLYTVTASAKGGAAPVAAVMPVAVAMKTETGARGVKLNVKEGSGGTVRQSAELALPSSFGEISAVFDRKNDGTAWTVADVNNLRMGYEVST